MSDNDKRPLDDFANKLIEAGGNANAQALVDERFGRNPYKNEVPVEFVKKIAGKYNPKDKDDSKYDVSNYILTEKVRAVVSKWDEVIFEKTLTFYLTYKQADRKIVDKSKLVDELVYKGFNEFVKLYEFFNDNKSNIKNLPKYLGDFKEFVDEKHLEKVEKFELEMLAIENQKAEWFKGVMDSFNQEPNDEKYWTNDSYFKGYQHGTDIFRNLMKCSKELFPTNIDPVKNEFVDQQRKLVKIINDIDKNIETEN